MLYGAITAFYTYQQGLTSFVQQGGEDAMFGVVGSMFELLLFLYRETFAFFLPPYTFRLPELMLLFDLSLLFNPELWMERLLDLAS